MTDSEIRDCFVTEIHKVAPDIDPGDIGDDDHLQDDLELDSMDVLTLVTALHARLGVSIPEPDYVQIETPAKAVRYLAARLRD